MRNTKLVLSFVIANLVCVLYFWKKHCFKLIFFTSDCMTFKELYLNVKLTDWARAIANFDFDLSPVGIGGHTARRRAGQTSVCGLRVATGSVPRFGSCRLVLAACKTT
jgi:hypothetical protein